MDTAAVRSEMGSAISESIAAVVVPDIVAQYQTDGAVVLRNVIDGHWLEVLADGVERNLKNPGPLARTYTRNEETSDGFFFGDAAVWQRVPEYEDFLFHSPVAQIAAVLTGASQVNLYFDGVFIRSKYTPSRTPWHQDVPYWPIEGDQMCTVWIPLDHVPRDGSVEYVKGSHRWGKVYRPKSFFKVDEDYAFNDSGLKPMPDFANLRDEYELLGWEMNPGDVQCFHGHIIHGAAGNETPQWRRTFQARLAGDGMTYTLRDGDMHPTFPDCGLQPGDPIGGPSFPRLFKRS